MDICLSGGAQGADKLWGEVAQAHGHDVCHFTFGGHGAASWAKGVKLTQLQLDSADPALIRANTTLQRTYPVAGHFVGNLLKRNYWQIVDTERVYAVGFMAKDGLPAGGTAWATQMYIDRMLIDEKATHPIELYFFEQQLGVWLRYDVDFGWTPMKDMPPIPSGRWTGIGTRSLLEVGSEAIRSVFR